MARGPGVPAARDRHRDCLFLWLGAPLAAALLRRLVEHLADVGQVLAAPEQLAVENKGRHAKNPDLFAGAADPFEFLAPLLRQIDGKPGGVCTGFGQDGGNDVGVFDVELALPEALELRVMVTSKDAVALPLGVQHAARGDRRIPDFLRAADHQPALARLASAIHVAVADAPPLMRGALFFEHAAAVVDARRAHKAGEVEIIGQPIGAHAAVLLKFVNEVLCEIGVRALVIDIDRESLRRAHACTWRISFAQRSSTGRISSDLAAGRRTFIRAMPRSRWYFNRSGSSGAPPNVTDNKRASRPASSAIRRKRGRYSSGSPERASAACGIRPSP